MDSTGTGLIVWALTVGFFGGLGWGVAMWLLSMLQSIRSSNG